SSNSIDHLHSKRDSAYSSFSTSSSIPEYLASTPSFSPERSYSLETVPQRAGGSAEMLQADIRYVRTVYDAQQGLSQEHELNSSRGGARSGPGRDHQASNRHSVGPIWGQAASRNSFESLKGAPAPPRRSDSYAAIRNHERPNSWSSSAATTSPPSRLILPASLYPVPQAEPQYAQTPSSGPGPGPSGVYTALTTESSRQQGVRNEERSDPRDKSRYGTGTSCCWIYWIFSCKSFILMSFFSSFRQRDQPSVHSELPGSSRVAQGQVLPTAGPTSIPQPSARHFSDSAAPQYQSGNHRESDKDSEHPLTRLEIALAEVQRCASPNTQDTSNTHSPARSLSVLEKVSHFERRKAGGKQRTYSTNSYSKAFHLGDSRRSYFSPAEKPQQLPTGRIKIWRHQQELSLAT
ncbi:hypothetical protein XENOCAPTIV_006929, partial [Xenoophorus captivus]